jgi:hypothetical protein
MRTSPGTYRAAWPSSRTTRPQARSAVRWSSWRTGTRGSGGCLWAVAAAAARRSQGGRSLQRIPRTLCSRCSSIRSQMTKAAAAAAEQKEVVTGSKTAKFSLRYVTSMLGIQSGSHLTRSHEWLIKIMTAPVLVLLKINFTLISTTTRF